MESLSILKNTHEARPRGFSLLEMVIVLAIIGLITGILLLGENDFNHSIVLTDTAYTIAFTFREAQSRGLSSRVFSNSGTNILNSGYGVHFDRTKPATYDLFADVSPSQPTSGGTNGLCPSSAPPGTPEARPGDCIYTVGSDAIVRSFVFNRNYTISDICATGSSGKDCASGSNLDTLDVVFQRPSTDSNIIGTKNGTSRAYTSAGITVKSPDGKSTRCISISKVGQIAVIATCP
ncbi:MAG: putative Type pilus pilin [Parcubacteria group bacterium]|nr:putative Type pilus pilin [Parcubacteria group bacterium]